jgi:hypothetical protein
MVVLRADFILALRIVRFWVTSTLLMADLIFGMLFSPPNGNHFTMRRKKMQGLPVYPFNFWLKLFLV